MARKIDVVARVYDRSGRLMATGENSYTKTHPIQYRYALRAGRPLKQYLHAEISAIIRALKNKNRTPYKIVVERYSKEGRPMMAKPCPVCMAAINEAGIRLVEYTVGNGREMIRLY